MEEEYAQSKPSLAKRSSIAGGLGGARATIIG
jgi:hypothetical protein